jgi:hypothetical protein
LLHLERSSRSSTLTRFLTFFASKLDITVWSALASFNVGPCNQSRAFSTDQTEKQLVTVNPIPLAIKTDNAAQATSPQYERTTHTGTETIRHIPSLLPQRFIDSNRPFAPLLTPGCARPLIRDSLFIFAVGFRAA